MNLIQIVLLVGLAASLVLAFVILRNQLIGRLFFLGQFLLGGFFVIFPDVTSKVAQKLGVGRGTDLLFYLFVVLFYLTALVFVAQIRRLNRQLTELAREIALLKTSHKNS